VSGVRQDYILRQIDLLRQFVKRVLVKNPDPELDEALLLALHLQEKLLPRPPAEFLQLGLTEQVAELRRGESRETANGKCRLYAELLEETARLYLHRGLSEYADGARLMGLHVALTVVLDDPTDAVAGQLVQDFLGALDPNLLHPPTVELLKQVGERPQ